jgi:hypothetical protein
MPYRLNAISGELDLVADIGSLGGIEQIDGDSGSVTPTAGVVNIIGTSAQGISSSGAGNTLTFTIADSTTSQKGVLETSTDAESIAGTSTSVAVTPESMKAKLGSQTQYGSPYGNGDTNALEWTAAGTDGQLLIAATSAAPAFASLTSTGGTVTFTPGANSLNLEAAGSVAITFDTDSGSATPAANTINIVGTSAQGITSSGAGDTVTFTVSDASTSQKGVSELATDAESIAGTDTGRTIVPSSLGAKLGAQTSKAIPYGAGTAAALSWTSALTDGQLVIGSTAGNPAVASLTSTNSTVTITPGSNSIDLSTGSSVAISFTTDGSAATPSSGVIDIAGGTLLTTSGATNVVTINADDNVVGSVASDSGTCTPSSNTFTIAGSGGITTSASGSTVTINGSGEQVITITALTDANDPYTVLSTDYYLSCNVSGGSLSIELPDAPTTGKVYIVKDAGGDAAGVNTLSVTTAGGVVTIDGDTTRNFVADYECLQFVFNGTSYEVF